MIKDPKESTPESMEAINGPEDSGDGSTNHSEGFNVENFHVETDTPDDKGFEAGAFAGGVTPPPVANKVNEMMLEVVFATLSKIAVALTGYQEVGLDDDEAEQLVGLWSPIMPGMSPMATAILGTTMIVSSKTFLLLHLKRQAKQIEAPGLAKKPEGGSDD